MENFDTIIYIVFSQCNGESMPFKNEMTWINYAKTGRESIFHSRYEKEISELRDDIKNPIIHENIIGGKRTKDREIVLKVSPNDNSLPLGYFQKAQIEDVASAVKLARSAFEIWSETDYVERVSIFERVVELFKREKFALAAALTLDNGKNRFEALADVDEAIDFMSYYCNQMRLNDGFEKLLPPAYDNERSESLLRPYGVWAVICPFNFPVAISIGMASAAMLTGNTVVIKPSTAAPFALYKAFCLMERAGIPPGVANFIYGSGGEIGSALTSHPEVEGVAFTGSKEVGFEIIRGSLRSYPIPVIAEMGSKNPVIVTKNADFKEAAEGIVNSAFGYAGQKCSACSRLYIEREVRDDVLQEILHLTKNIKVKDPAERDCTFGPLIEERKVIEYLEVAKIGSRDGAIIIGGHRIIEGNLIRGFYVEPMIIDALPQEHELMRTELFMPVLCIDTFDSLDEAISKANSSAYGLTAGIFTHDENEVDLFFRKIKSGVVYSNRRRGACTGAMVGAQSFVGWKSSGSTGKGTGGPYYLQQFLREQTRTKAW
ncbi:MAG: aldehyde dehydrogenase family protein [Methanomassiliicoccales archaeon]